MGCLVYCRCSLEFRASLCCSLGAVFGKIGAIVGLSEILCNLFEMSLNIVGMSSGLYLNV